MPKGHVTIGTQVLSRPATRDAGPPSAPALAEVGYPWDEHVPPPGKDATLLVVVPIPGTQTSLAIVGYAISTSGALEPMRGPASSRPDLSAEPATGLLIDHDQRRVWADGAEVTLTFQEFELLAFLSAYPATVFSRADLVKHVWRPGPEPDRPNLRPNVRRDSRTVDVHVSRLRRKLGPVHGQCLVTEHRAGYQFRPLAP